MKKTQNIFDTEYSLDRYVRRSFDVFLVMFSAVTISIASMGKDRFWIPWICLIPAFFVLYRSNFTRAFRFGALAGAIKCITIWFWVITVTKYMLKTMWSGIVFLAGLTLLYSLLFGIMYSLISYILRTFRNRYTCLSRLVIGMATASLWVALEFLYTTLLILTGQAMPLGIGYTQWNHPLILQIVSLTGHYGVSFLIVLFNISIADDIWRKRLCLTPFAVVIVGLCIVFGYLRIQTASSSQYDASINVSILQGNIPPYDKFDQKKANFIAHRYLELGQLSNRINPQLIVWTESAIPWPLREDDDLMTTMLRVTAQSGAYHILGTTLQVPNESNTYYNTVLFVHPDGQITSQYNKRYLLTFVEKTVHLPLIMPASGTIHPATRKYRSGTLLPILHSPFGRIGVMVCNESLYPSAARQSVLAGAKFITLLANDVWFREDVPIDCHFMVTLFRAVETGRDLIIANNVGNSGIVDAFGRIIIRSEKRVHLCLSGTVQKRIGKTFYVRLGDIFATVCSCIAFCTITFCFLIKKQTITQKYN